MTIHNAGARRPANDDARARRMASAQDLVRRTLAQHGLLGQGSPVQGPQPGAQRAAQPDILKTVQDALAQAGLMGDAPGETPLDLPDGAEFRHATHRGSTGARAYRTYVPASLGASASAASGIVMMLHGCTQSPEDFARGTGMNALAEQHRFIVVYPHQNRGANAQSCWNWFSPNDQARGRGEPAILAGIAQAAIAEFGVPADKVFVAGLSAGAAMALILGAAYPELFAAVGAHSGLPVGAANDVASAFAAMAGAAGPSSGAGDVAAIRRCIILHGSADATVQPANGDAIARQVAASGPAQTIETSERGQSGGRDFHRTITSANDGTVLSEHWRIEGLGHAWSGGRPGGSHTDPTGPDASAEMVRFFFETNSRDS